MQLASTHSGEGFPLLVLHGLFGSSGNWRSIARALSSSFEVYALDQRNHGRSPHSPVMSYDVMAGDVIEFLDLHRIARADMIGHSMGGKTAMRVAQRAPERLNRLVVVDIAPGSTEAGQARTIQALRTVDLTTMRTREEVGHALSHEIPDRRVRQFLLTNLRRDSAGRLSWKLNLEAIEEHHDALLGPIPEGNPVAIPTLFIRGARSNHLRTDDEADIRRRFQNVWIVTIDGAGHWVHAERPEQFLDVVRKFLMAGDIPS